MCDYEFEVRDLFFCDYYLFFRMCVSCYFSCERLVFKVCIFVYYGF